MKRKEETWREAARRLKEKLVRERNWNVPEIEKEDKLIISHTHAPFYDMENGVFATGGWKIKRELKEKKEYIRRNVGVFIVADGEERNDPIQMKKWFRKEEGEGLKKERA